MDGSRLGLWLNEEGRTVFIHLGSGSGSDLACVIAESGIDFMRLLGIGYLSLGEAYDLSQPPHYSHEENKTNPIFCHWVEKTFNTTIPETAAEIIKHPSHFLSDDPQTDPFCRWIIDLCNHEYS